MGFEPTTFCMASRRSSQLSYSRAVPNSSFAPRDSAIPDALAAGPETGSEAAACPFPVHWSAWSNAARCSPTSRSPPLRRPLVPAEGEASVAVPELLGDVDRIVPQRGPKARVPPPQPVRRHRSDAVDVPVLAGELEHLRRPQSVLLIAFGRSRPSPQETARRGRALGRGWCAGTRLARTLHRRRDPRSPFASLRRVARYTEGAQQVAVAMLSRLPQ